MSEYICRHKMPHLHKVWGPG